MKAIIRSLVVLFSLCGLVTVSSAGNNNNSTNLVPLGQQPLLTATSEPPNIMFVIDNSDTMNQTVSGSQGQTALAMAQQTVTSLLQNLSNVNVGLTSFSGSDAEILVGMGSISTNLNTMISAINNLETQDEAPLASTQLELGRYFVQGNNNKLTLHPGQSDQTTKPAYSIFDKQPDVPKGVSDVSPIQFYCQQSFIIWLSAGDPHDDGQPDPGTGLTDYVYTQEDCPVGQDTGSGSNSGSHSNSSAVFGYHFDNGGGSGAGFNPDMTCALPNEAAAMYDIDLRPDLTSPTGAAKKNNVVTYTIGFPVLPEGSGGSSRGGSFNNGSSTNNNLGTDMTLLQITAQNAGGAFYYSTNTSGLIQALETASASIQNQSVTASSISFNSQNLTTSSAIYQPQYTTTYWSGDLFKIPIGINGVLGAALWDAGVILTQEAYQNRLVFTYNNDSNANTPILFQTLTKLAAAQQTDLNTGIAGSNDGNGQLRLNYLLGDRSNEQTSTNKSNLFRQRASVLGDIANSAPVYVGTAQANWPNIAPFPTATGQTYSSFKIGIASTRTPMVYVGANDGMLHGFNANTGSEVMAYVPLSLSNDFNTALQTEQGITLSNSAAIPLDLHYYTNPAYTHRFYVDGTPAIQDAYFASRSQGSAAWHTVLVGGERAGGKGYYAIDVTNPAFFTMANFPNMFLWEFSNANNLDLGNTYSDPQIGLMNNGRWAAIFGNGYNATGTNDGTLFIVFLDGGKNGTWVKGTDYIEISTHSGVATQNNTPNGLATPAAVDVDGNGTIDRIYAGDLNGDIWAFNVSSANASSWATAYGTSASPTPLYNGPATQPITTQPVVAVNPSAVATSSNSPNLLVMVGTGQYLSASDQANTATQAFIGVWDAGTSNIMQTQLVQQTFTTSGTFRIMSQNSVAFNTGSKGVFGWYIQFTGGERIVFPASVFQVRINNNQFQSEVGFSTFLPNTANACSYGGTGYFMVVQVATGGQPSTTILDINNQGVINSGDNINGQVVSGVQFTSAAPSQAVIRGDYLFIPTSNGTLQKMLIATTGLPTGRLSWSVLKQS
ncbi:MAG: VWA domain-containing protein [Legionellales bacterium]|nr:VWA domain-containing protein [Legionellales bacterium]